MELQQLRHFLATVKHGNMGKASEELHITQSGLSRSVLNLERQLGLTLLKRNPRGVEPTPFGLSLIPHAQAMLNKEQRAIRELESLKRLQTGSVSIGITLNYSHYFVPDLLSELMTDYPSIEIEVRSGAYVDLVDSLRRAEIDCVFGLLAIGLEYDDLCVEELFTTRSIIVARKNHPFARKRKLTHQDLSEADWAMLSGEGFQRAFQNYFYVKGCPAPRQVFKTNSLALIKNIVAAQDLLTVLPKEIVSDEIKRKQLVHIDIETPADFARAGLLYRQDGVTTPAMEVVIEKFRAHSESQPGG